MKSNELYDLVGIGIGPFNLSLAALSNNTNLKTLFLEKKDKFNWHPGLLIEGTTLQVPFMCDLVTMADPSHPLSFLNYLHKQDRLYRFYFREEFLIPRKEYNHYCQWASQQLPQCKFGYEVIDISIIDNNGEKYYQVHYSDNISKKYHVVMAKNIALGIGSVPALPKVVSEIIFDNKNSIFHSSEFLNKKSSIIPNNKNKQIVTVLGSGQSAGEIYYDLLQNQRLDDEDGDEYSLRWLTRGNGFFPMEYSKLGLEHFTPDYQAYFHALPQTKKDNIISKQDLLYKGMSSILIANIYDLLYEREVLNQPADSFLLALSELKEITINTSGPRYSLTFEHRQDEKKFTIETDILICSTGYNHQLPPFIAGINDDINWDISTGKKRFKIDKKYRLKTSSNIGSIYIQNGELHTHGIGAPDLGLGAHRSAVIINDLLKTDYYKINDKNSFLNFGSSSSKAIKKDCSHDS
jgi:lysine N6-hydroxylase